MDKRSNDLRNEQRENVSPDSPAEKDIELTSDQEVKAEPYAALVGGIEVHSELVELAGVWLKPEGWLVVEIGDSQGPEVAALFQRRLADVEVVPDLAGRDRVVRGRLSGPSGGPPVRDPAE